MYIVLDTETTGLPCNGGKLPSYKNLGCYDKCRLLSIAIVEYDDNGKELGYYYQLAKTVDVSGTDIHGINQIDVDENGIDLEQIYADVSLILREHKTLIGHNINFDINILKSEFYRMNFDLSIFDNLEIVCTLSLCKSIFFVPMKLKDLYKLLNKTDIVDAHNALNDCRATNEVYLKLREDPRKNLGTIKTKCVYIRVSDVGFIVNNYAYKKPFDILKDYWLKYNPDNFEGKTLNQMQNEAIESSPFEIKKLCESIKKIKTENSDDLEKQSDNVCNVIKSNNELTENNKKLIIERVEKILNTNHGIYHENNTFNNIPNIIKDNNIYEIFLCKYGDTNYFLRGKVDGVQKNEDGSYTLIEIKNRKKQLAGILKDYEYAQVQLYLHMNKKWKNAKLYEQFNTQIKHYDIEINENIINDIIKKTSNFCKTLHYFMSN